MLATAGLRFRTRALPVEEKRRDGESPVEYVLRLARAKAEAGWRTGEVVLGADTVVVVDHAVLEKPRDEADAARMLKMLSGRQHKVITGICFRHDDGALLDHSMTKVTFCTMTDSEIGEYVRSGEPMGKAGSYAIQGLASKFIERIEGCYFNVMGLPLSLVYKHWKILGAPE